MSLDRESIERKDFPVEARGYDPRAVDAHLSALANEVEELRCGGSHSPSETLAGAVSEQVGRIVEAAENSAEEILGGAELEAQEIRARASHATERATGEAQRVRERATARAREYVDRLSSSISALLGRLEAIDGELNSLTASLRRETERLRGELVALGDELSGAMGATEVPGRAPLEPSGEAAGVSEPVHVHEPAVNAEVAEPAPESGAQAGVELPASEERNSEDTEGARLIALNMALNGTPRDETERYLAENYDLADRQRVLDEVYASVQD